MADTEIINATNLAPGVFSALTALAAALNVRLAEIEQRIEAIEDSR